MTGEGGGEEEKRDELGAEGQERRRRRTKRIKKEVKRPGGKWTNRTQFQNGWVTGRRWRNGSEARGLEWFRVGAVSAHACMCACVCE